MTTAPLERPRLAGRRARRFDRCALTLLACVSVASAARAARGDGPTVADALFDKGVELLEAKRYDKACPLFEESYRADPKPGALFALGQCEAGRGRIAAASARFDEYLALYAKLPPDGKARHADRERLARAEIKRLAPDVPKLIVELPPSTPPDTVVKFDGAALAPAVMGVAIPADPGEHVLTTQVPGGSETPTRVTIDKGERKQVLLEVRGAPQLAAPNAEPAPSPPPPPAPREVPPAASGHAPVWLLATGIGLTVAGLGAGAGFTVAANAQARAADDQLAAIQRLTPSGGQLCPTPTTPECVDLAATQRSQDRFTGAAVALYVTGGVAALGTLAALIFWPQGEGPASGLVLTPMLGGAAPGPRGHAGSLGAGPNGVMITGSF